MAGVAVGVGVTVSVVGVGELVEVAVAVGVGVAVAVGSTVAEGVGLLIWARPFGGISAAGWLQPNKPRLTANNSQRWMGHNFFILKPLLSACAGTNILSVLVWIDRHRPGRSPAAAG
jgi:hypothetical protein